MRRIKITVSTIWTVDPEDNKMADAMLDDRPPNEEVAIDYILDSKGGNSEPELSRPEVKLEELKD